MRNLSLSPSHARELSETGKTVVWAPMVPQPELSMPSKRYASWRASPDAPGFLWTVGREPSAPLAEHCSPFGAPGEAFYVGEEWSNNHSVHVSHNGLLYKSTALQDQSWHGNWATLRDGIWFDYYDRPLVWRPAEVMPEWAARTRGVIDSVTVERGENGWSWVVTLRREA